MPNEMTKGVDTNDANVISLGHNEMCARMQEVVRHASVWRGPDLWRTFQTKYLCVACSALLC